MTILVTTLNSEVVHGGAAAGDKQPPLKSLLLSTKDSFNLA